MFITGTHFNYYQLCRRKLWLFANGISMEHESELVYEGKLVHESSYPQRTSRYEEVEIDGIKVDYFDVKNKVIHEIKKSNKVDKVRIPVDTRSPIPVISVQSVGDLQYRRQS